jgi:3-deoxy-D-manno-octulosonic-acid transferase
MHARSWRRVAGALDRHPLSTSLLYRAVARVGFGALPFAARFSAKLAAAMPGRGAAVATLKSWAASYRDRSRPLVWFHAPSVGEGLQARAILEVLRRRHPDWQIAFTHFSPSAEAAAARQPADVHAYLPADIPADVEAALDALAPTALVFVKLDVWPELASRAAARDVPVLLVAATVSPVSGRTGWPARAFTRAGYEVIAHAGAIAEDDAKRLEILGVPRDRITITGDPRFDSVTAMVSASATEAPLIERTGVPAIVAGSTWGLDEEVLLEAYGTVRRAHPAARLILAPHEPTSGHLEAVDALAARFGLGKPVRLALATGREEFILVDRVGVLARLYGSGDAAYVGGGFGRAGLHSVLEPAAWGVPVVFGPRWRSSREAGLLSDAGGGMALPVSGAPAQLAKLWQMWLNDEKSRRGAGSRALHVVEAGRGGAEKNASLVETAI